MLYAAELHFTPADSAPIFALAQSIAEACQSTPLAGTGWGPHVTLAVFDELPGASAGDGAVPEQVERWLATFAREVHGLTLEFAAVGLFPGDEGVLFLAPLVTAQLLAHHRAFHEPLPALGLTSRGYYLPDRWVPHCTIGFQLAPSALVQAAAMAQQAPLPIHVTVTALRLIALHKPHPTAKPLVSVLGTY